MTTYVYFLTDPQFPRWPRYVGITSNPAERARRHRFHSTTNGPFDRWKANLRSFGLAPCLSVVAWYPSIELARRAEWRLIHRWRRRGLCDLNSASDGSARAFARRYGSDEEPTPRFELGTARLRIGCSTTELSRRTSTEAREPDCHEMQRLEEIMHQTFGNPTKYNLNETRAVVSQPTTARSQDDG